MSYFIVCTQDKHNRTNSQQPTLPALCVKRSFIILFPFLWDSIISELNTLFFLSCVSLTDYYFILCSIWNYELVLLVLMMDVEWILVWKFSCRHHQSQLGMHNGHIIIVTRHTRHDGRWLWLFFRFCTHLFSRTLLSSKPYLLAWFVERECGGGGGMVVVTSCVSFLLKNESLSGYISELYPSIPITYWYVSFLRSSSSIFPLSTHI